MWVAPAIMAAGSIASQFLGGKNKGPSFSDQKSWMREQMMSKIKWTVDDAKRSGIHPLVALGSQAAGGFAGPAGGFDTGGSGWGDAIGDALSATAELYESDLDRRERAEQTRYARDQDERARMDQIAADTIASGERAQAQKLREAEIRRLDSETALNAARSRTELMNARHRAVGGAGITTPSVLTDAFGNQLMPLNTPAETYENHYGDIVNEFYGLSNWLKDVLTDPRTGEGHARKWFREQMSPSVSAPGYKTGLPNP